MNICTRASDFWTEITTTLTTDKGTTLTIDNYYFTKK